MRRSHLADSMDAKTPGFQGVLGSRRDCPPLRSEVIFPLRVGRIDPRCRNDEAFPGCLRRFGDAKDAIKVGA